MKRARIKAIEFRESDNKTVQDKNPWLYGIIS